MRKIDAKYHIDWQTEEPPDPRFEPYNVQIVSTSTEEPIPIDEPLFLFRARDRLASHVLSYYYQLCQNDGCTASQIEGVQDAAFKFLAFKRQYPDRMKQPGCTMVKPG